MNEIKETLGMEAARNFLIERLTLILTTIDNGINLKHIILIADYMTYTGHILQNTVEGLRKLGIDIIHRVSVGKAMTELPRSAITGENVPLASPSSYLFFGLPPKIGKRFDELSEKQMEETKKKLKTMKREGKIYPLVSPSEMEELLKTERENDINIQYEEIISNTSNLNIESNISYSKSAHSPEIKEVSGENIPVFVQPEDKKTENLKKILNRGPINKEIEKASQSRKVRNNLPSVRRYVKKEEETTPFDEELPDDVTETQLTTETIYPPIFKKNMKEFMAFDMKIFETEIETVSVSKQEISLPLQKVRVRERYRYVDKEKEFETARKKNEEYINQTKIMKNREQEQEEKEDSDENIVMRKPIIKERKIIPKTRKLRRTNIETMVVAEIEPEVEKIVEVEEIKFEEEPEIEERKIFPELSAKKTIIPLGLVTRPKAIDISKQLE